MSETNVPHSPAAAPIPTHAELFLAFFRITLSGFGGTLAWTRIMFVEKKRWMTSEDFNDQYRQPHRGVRLADARSDRRDGGLGGVFDRAVLRDGRRRYAL
jgi:hypothetical protein